MLMTLRQFALTGDGLPDRDGPKKVGNISRRLFDEVAEENCRLGLATFDGSKHFITVDGRAFFEQRYDVQPCGKDVFVAVPREGSRTLPPMDDGLLQELTRANRRMKTFEAAAGLFFVLVLGLIVYYAQAH